VTFSPLALAVFYSAVTKSSERLAQPSYPWTDDAHGWVLTDTPSVNM
jgi:hypothetical protein